METDTLTFPNIERVLREYAESAGDTYRSYMQLGGKDASGELSQSAKAELRVDGGHFEVVMHLAEYWKWVEQGRKAGKFPPPDKIRQWIEVKPVIPRPMKNGKLPKIQQLAYLIGRKIATVGIKPTPVLELTVKELNERFMVQINEALRQDVTYMMKASIKSAFE